MIQRTEHSDRQDNYHPVNPDDPVKKDLSGYIATYCIERNLGLLHFDRDFDPLESHLNLKSVNV